MLSHVVFFAAAALVPAGGYLFAATHKSKTPEQLRSQIDQGLDTRLHRLLLSGAPDYAFAEAIGGLRGVLHLLRQAAIHIALLQSLGKEAPRSSELHELRLRAIFEVLRHRRLVFPVLRRCVECYCAITAASDDALNEIDARQ